MRKITTLKSLAKALGVSVARARNLVSHNCIVPYNEIKAGDKTMREYTKAEVDFVKEMADASLFEAINFALYYKNLYFKEKEKNGADKKTKEKKE